MGVPEHLRAYYLVAADPEPLAYAPTLLIRQSVRARHVLPWRERWPLRRAGYRRAPLGPVVVPLDVARASTAAFAQLVMGVAPAPAVAQLSGLVDRALRELAPSHAGDTLPADDVLAAARAMSQGR